MSSWLHPLKSWSLRETRGGSVTRQYTGSAGKITNCQIGVFAAYVSRHGHAFIDRALYLPKDWTDDPLRMAAAHVPKGIGFSTKPRIGQDMIERAIAANTPFAWVAADSVYGVGHLETALRRAGKGYVLGVKGTHAVKAWIDRPWISGTAEQVAQALPPSAWRCCSAGEGTQGPRLHEWAYRELADLGASDYGLSARRLWTRGLLIRRRLDGKLTYFTTWAPAGTPLEKLAWVEGQRWAIENAFETAKNELGLDHNETRSWHGWYRHVSLVMLAFALLAAVRHCANAMAPPKTARRLASLLRPC